MVPGEEGVTGPEGPAGCDAAAAPACRPGEGVVDLDSGE